MELSYIRQIIEGDVSGYTYFIDTYKHMAYTIAYRILNNKEDAEETVQDSFLKAFKALPKFRGNSKFSTWFYKIVIHSSYSRLKSRKPVRWLTMDENPDEVESGIIEDACDHLEQADRRKFIDRALSRLESGDSLVLTLYYLGENSMEEISDITGSPVENIKMKIHRARKKMLAVLHDILKTETNSIA